jgi:hypothetical protein
VTRHGTAGSQLRDTRSAVSTAMGRCTRGSLMRNSATWRQVRRRWYAWISPWRAACSNRPADRNFVQVIAAWRLQQRPAPSADCRSRGRPLHLRSTPEMHKGSPEGGRRHGKAEPTADDLKSPLPPVHGKRRLPISEEERTSAPIRVYAVNRLIHSRHSLGRFTAGVKPGLTRAAVRGAISATARSQ